MAAQTCGRLLVVHRERSPPHCTCHAQAILWSLLCLAWSAFGLGLHVRSLGVVGLGCSARVLLRGIRGSCGGGESIHGGFVLVALRVSTRAAESFSSWSWGPWSATAPNIQVAREHLDWTAELFALGAALLPCWSHPSVAQRRAQGSLLVRARGFLRRCPSVGAGGDATNSILRVAAHGCPPNVRLRTGGVRPSRGAIRRQRRQARSDQARNQATEWITATTMMTLRMATPHRGSERNIEGLDGMLAVKPAYENCAQATEDCLVPRCCGAAGLNCFKVSGTKGRCMKACTPGGSNGTCEGVAPHMRPVAETPGLSLFCFAVHQEPVLFLLQLERRASFFSCTE